MTVSRAFGGGHKCQRERELECFREREREGERKGGEKMGYGRRSMGDGCTRKITREGER